MRRPDIDTRCSIGYIQAMGTFVPFPEERGPEKLREVLSRLYTSKRFGQVSAQARLETAWAEAVGPRWGAVSRAVVIKRGVLEVHVADAGTHQQLVMEKEQVLERLRPLLGQAVRDVRFRVEQ